MGGEVMWIVLGSLIGVVAIFLIVTSTLDRKKSKKLKIEKETLSKEISVAGKIVSDQVVKTIENNDKRMRKFIPSVGKVKMSEINKLAKEELKEINSSKNFKLLKHNEDQFNLFSNHISALISEKSNNWVKRNQDDIKFFLNYETPTPPKPKTKKSKKDIKSKKAKK